MLHKKKVNKCTTKRPTAGHGVTMLPCCSLWLLRCHKRSGTEASRRGKKWMSECRPDMIRMFENHRFLVVFFDPWRAKPSHRAGETQTSLSSHKPANRNECPCGKHFLTSPANTSILSLSLKNQNPKPVTLTRAPSQPAAMFFQRVLASQNGCV